MKPPVSVFAVDIGNAKNFAWVNSESAFGDDGVSLVQALSCDLGRGCHVAVGFECPLFIPVPFEWEQIGKARVGEGSRPWSGGAGGSITGYGMHEVAWVLRELLIMLNRLGLAPPIVTFKPEEWRVDLPKLLIWEAFVTGKAKRDSHHSDACEALKTFQLMATSGNWDDGRKVATDNAAAAMNLAALAARWAGWPVHDSQLTESTLVVRP